jgi:CDP-diacylglycerol pyrophosphatase
MEFHLDVLAGHLNFFKADTAPHNGIHTRVLPSQCFNPTFVALHWLQQRGVGLAVNSKQHRTQDQLHIHIECLGAEVYRVLRTAGERRSDRWAVIRLAQWRYQGMRVMGEGLEQTNPFELLAQRMPGAREDMGAYTLMVAGMQFKEGPGFILLTGKNVPGAESLLDSTCAIANR